MCNETEYFKGQPTKASELKLGDVVQVDCTEWNTAIVKNIDADNVYLFRPYGISSDFSHTGGVICYTGIEEYSVPMSYTVKLFRRTNPR